MKAIFLSCFAILTMSCSQPSTSMNDSTAAQLANAQPGTFVAVGGHKTEGSVQIEDRADGLYLILNEDFKSQTGPDLRVVVRDSKQSVPMLIAGPLLAQQGRQEYKLNLSDNELQSFDQISIYCAKFHVDFAIARIR